MLTEKEEADNKLRATIAAKFLDALNVVLVPLGRGTIADIVLAFDDALTILREYQDSLRDACREVRNSQPPPPRPSSEHPARSGTMPSPSEGAARDDWKLTDQLNLAARAPNAPANARDSVAPRSPKRLSTIRPPPPSTGIPPVPSIATAATDPAPPPKPKPRPKAKKAAARTKAKQKRKR